MPRLRVNISSFESLDGGPVGLEPVELVASPAAAHFRYARGPAARR